MNKILERVVELERNTSSRVRLGKGDEKVNKKLIWVKVTAALLVATILAALPQAASQASGNLYDLAFPFDEGVEWKVTGGGGYSNGDLHTGYALYALDLVRVDGNTAGLRVRLPADASYYRLQNTPAKCIDVAIGSWSGTHDLYLEICHVDFVGNLGEILSRYNMLPKGLVLGTVAQAGTCGGGCPISHIHIAAHVSPKGNPFSGGSRTPMEFANHGSFSLALNGHEFPSNGIHNEWHDWPGLYAHYPDGEPNFLNPGVCNGQSYNVVLYLHINFGGECIPLMDLSNPYDVPSWMHVSSIYVSPSWNETHDLYFYSEYGLGGFVGVAVTSIPDLTEYKDGWWNDNIKSLHNAYTGATWLTEFSIADSPPLGTDIHVVVQDPGNHDALRVCFNGGNCQETGATELFYYWPTYLEQEGTYAITVERRLLSDNQNWANSDVLEFAYYLNHYGPYAACDGGNGAILVSGSDCIRVSGNVSDLGFAGWGDRSGLEITARGYDVLAYNSSEWEGPPYLIRDNETLSVGGNVSSIELRDPLSGPYVPDQPLGIDANTIAYIQLDEGSGSSVYSSVGSLSGNLVGDARFVTGRFDQAVGFSGSGGVNFGSVNFGYPMTVELFVKLNALGNDQRIATQIGGGPNTGYNRWLVGSVGNRYRIWACHQYGCHETFSIEDAKVGVWQYLMLAYDGANTAKFYVNSVLQATVSMDFVMSPGSTTFEIGQGEGIYGCDCVIDEVRISNVVREPVGPQPNPTPTPTPTATATFTPTVTATYTSTPTSTVQPTATPTVTESVAGVELLTQPMNLSINNGSAEAYQSIPADVLQDRDTVRVTYDLHGLNAYGGDASALIFDQNGWQYVSLSGYGQNGLDGVQTVDIPLSHFMNLDPNQSVGTLHTRFWCDCTATADITSVFVYSSGSATATPVATPTPTPTATVTPNPTNTPASALPVPWSNTDIGSPALSGTVAYNNGVFTVEGSGVDIWNSDDEFHYVYQPLLGDGQIVVRVNSHENTHEWAKAGVMIKQSASAGAPYALMAITPGHGYEFQFGFNQSMHGQSYSLPTWLKLVRSGNSFTGYTSDDGVSWVERGSTTISMNTQATIGLFVLSHDASRLSTAVFDNVSVGSGGSLTQTPTPTATVAATATPTASQTATATAAATSTPTATNMPIATPTVATSGTELLAQAWHLVGSYGAAEAYQSISANALQGRDTVRVTYDLHGLNAYGGDASALIFDQNGWQYVSLSGYGQNGLDGVQTVDIPLSHFMNLDPDQSVGTLHTRFWCDCNFTVDITSIVVYDSTP